MKNLSKFGKSLKNFASERVNELRVAGVHDFADALRELLRSGRANMSARKLNQLFKDRNHVDENGELIRVANPAEIADKIIVVGDVVMIALTQDEDRWFRADAIFGSNILSELGIKYRQE